MTTLIATTPKMDLAIQDIEHLVEELRAYHAIEFRDGDKITSRFTFTAERPSSSTLAGAFQRRSAWAF